MLQNRTNKLIDLKYNPKSKSPEEWRMVCLCVCEVHSKLSQKEFYDASNRNHT